MSGEEDLEFRGILQHLDRELAHIVVRLESRKFGKPVTIIEMHGYEKMRERLVELSRDLKHRLATGGSAKKGMILLQGDHREKVKARMVELGFPPENVEVL